MLLMLLRRVVANLGSLAKLEPANVVKEPPATGVQQQG
jgi:hypothetical protein